MAGFALTILEPRPAAACKAPAGSVSHNPTPHPSAIQAPGGSVIMGFKVAVVGAPDIAGRAHDRYLEAHDDTPSGSLNCRRMRGWIVTYAAGRRFTSGCWSRLQDRQGKPRHDLCPILAALSRGACRQADAGAAFLRHRRGGAGADPVRRDPRLAVSRRRAGHRLCLRLDRPFRLRAQQAGNLRPPVLVALQRFTYAGAVRRRTAFRRERARREQEVTMTTAVPPIDDTAASPEVRAVYDDIRKTRDTDYINNFWRVLANDCLLYTSDA